ncbi:MAG: hypothetical protein R3344_16070, partial [Acidobacteriota bacterium]|nr:hypothetical protein [Acidobacteriota bacterium]
RWDSQFVDETNPSKNLFLNPNRFSETAGAAREFLMDEERSRELVTRVGFGFVQNVSRHFPDPASDQTESQTTNEGGFEWQTDALWAWANGRLLYRGQLLVFVPVAFSEADALKEFDEIAIAADPGREQIQDFWKVPTVNFQNTFDAKVTEWLALNLFVQLIYEKFDRTTVIDPAAPEVVDAGIRKAGQFKQTLAVSLTYRFR